MPLMRVASFRLHLRITLRGMNKLPVLIELLLNHFEPSVSSSSN